MKINKQFPALLLVLGGLLINACNMLETGKQDKELGIRQEIEKLEQERNNAIEQLINNSFLKTQGSTYSQLILDTYNRLKVDDPEQIVPIILKFYKDVDKKELNYETLQQVVKQAKINGKKDHTKLQIYDLKGSKAMSFQDAKHFLEEINKIKEILTPLAEKINEKKQELAPYNASF